jgi:type II secretory ATPase GspE/PulE/Tfp pilus assembly ATPase PilB-like protein
MVVEEPSIVAGASFMAKLAQPSGGFTATTTAPEMIGQIQILDLEDPAAARDLLLAEKEALLAQAAEVEVNRHTGLTFAAGLRHIARQDPDVIVIGEILDKETGQLAIQDALGGHLVLSTMFGSRFQSVITKLKNLPINSHVLADGLNAILSQRLIRRLCPHCKEAVEVDRETLQEHLPAAAALPGDATYRLYRHVGCDHCKQSGYLGRIALCELLEIDKEVRQMIRTDRESHELDAYLAAQQVKSLEEDALAKLLQGITDIAEITRLF